MRYLVWAWRIVLFLLFMGFALKNTEVVALRYYFGAEWRAPLTLLLLVFFGTGVGIGIISCLATIFKLRREITLLKTKKP